MSLRGYGWPVVTGLCATMLMFCVCSQSRGVVLYTFEDSAYTAGSTVIGVDNWLDVSGINSGTNAAKAYITPGAITTVISGAKSLALTPQSTAYKSYVQHLFGLSESYWTTGGTTTIEWDMISGTTGTVGGYLSLGETSLITAGGVVQTGGVFKMFSGATLHAASGAFTAASTVTAVAGKTYHAKMLTADTNSDGVYDTLEGYITDYNNTTTYLGKGYLVDAANNATTANLVASSGIALTAKSSGSSGIFDNVSLVAAAQASYNSFNGNTTDYNAAGNWSLGWAPKAGDKAEINNGKSASLNTAVTGQPDSLFVGNAGTAGNLNIQTAGALTVNGAVIVGNGGTNTTPLSTLTVSGGALYINGTSQSMIGGDSKAPGKLVISGGTLGINTTSDKSGDGDSVLGIGGIYAAGTGSVEQSGGQVYITTGSTNTRLSGLGLGTYTGGNGTYTMSGGTLSVGSFTDNDVDGDTEMNMFVGYKGQGTFVQTGGVVNVSRKLTIGAQAGVSSVYDMSSGNGVLNNANYGELIVSNGGADSLLVGGNSTVNVGGLRLGRGNGNGTVTMTGGTVNVVGATGIYTSGTGTLNLNGGLLDMHGNNIKSLTSFNFTGGELRNANVDFSFSQNGGKFAPGAGASAGSSTITGDYAQNSGILAFDILGTGTPGESLTFDHLNVTGAATLNGTIAVSVLAGYAPKAGDSFDLLDWGASLTGTPTWDLPTLGGGLSWDTSEFFASGTISIVPEPGTFLLLSFGAAALVVFAWRKRK